MFYKKLFKNKVLTVLLLTVLASICPHAACSACEHVTSQTSQCRTSSETRLQTSLQTCLQTCLTQEPARGHEPYQNLVTHGNILKMHALNENTSCKAALHDIQKESRQKVEALQNDPGFQEIVGELQGRISKDSITFKDLNKETKGELYIFISFSMGVKALLNLAHEAKQFGVTLVLRGFKDGSYFKTAQALQKIILETGQGVIIDPELYTLFNITAVPTFVLAKPFNLMATERVQTPLHDKLQGHVSVKYVLEMFAKEGDLKQEAQQLLSEGATP